MKLDEKYSYIVVCPKTGEQLTENQRSYHGGICPHCGHDNDASYTHDKKIVGRWNRPSFVERWFNGKKPEFLRKDEEDKIMDALKGDIEPKGQQESDMDDQLERIRQLIDN